MDKHRMDVVEYSKRQIEIVEEGTETHVAFLNNNRCGRLLAHWIVGCCNREVAAIERRRGLRCTGRGKGDYITGGSDVAKKRKCNKCLNGEYPCRYGIQRDNCGRANIPWNR